MGWCLRKGLFGQEQVATLPENTTQPHPADTRSLPPLASWTARRSSSTKPRPLISGEPFSIGLDRSSGREGGSRNEHADSEPSRKTSSTPGSADQASCRGLLTGASGGCKLRRGPPVASRCRLLSHALLPAALIALLRRPGPAAGPLAGRIRDSRRGRPRSRFGLDAGVSPSHPGFGMRRLAGHADIARSCARGRPGFATAGTTALGSQHP